MSLDTLAGPLAQALADTAARAAHAIAADVPADVAVAIESGAIRLTGRALTLRSLTDARLRDFAAIVKAGR